MSWLQDLFKKKRRLSVQELAQKLATAFSDEVQEMLSDRSSNGWVWQALPHADPKVVVSELTIVHFFIRSLGFIPHSRDKHTAEALLNCFCGYACQDLVNKGLLPVDCDFRGLLHKRFETYYSAMRGSNDPSFQIMRIGEAFFRLCSSSYDAVGLGAATIYLHHLLVAEKELITTLEKDIVIVS